MASTEPPKRYIDFPEALNWHRKVYDNSLLRPLKPVLPPGLDQAQFDRAIRELVDALGSSNVCIGEGLRDYVDPYEIWEIEGKPSVPSAAVLPRSVDEVKEVLQIANRFSIPLWTFSLGKNFGYGGPAPIVNGSIALDLHRMNKIIEVNDNLCYAVVEPGVTFQALFDHCVKQDLKVWPSAPSLPWGSVLGNALDRGMGYLPTGVHYEQIAGMEVVLANGEVVRTGQFAIENSKSAHVSKHTFGPSIEGLFLQSNLGIVTKVGIWLLPRPQSYMFCTFDLPEMEDVATMVDVIGPLRRNGVIDSITWVVGATEIIATRFKRAEIWKEKGPIPFWRLKEIMKKMDLGFWTAQFGIHGPEEIVKARFEEIKKVVTERAPTGRLRGTLYAGKSAEILSGNVLAKGNPDMYVGKANFKPFRILNFNLPLDDSRCIRAHRDFAPIMPADGKTVLEWTETARKICEAEGFDLFCDFFIQERSVIFVYMTTYDKANPQHRKALRNIVAKFSEEAQKRSFAVYRSHINEMDRNASALDFNNHAYRRFVESLKDTVDPKGILSPGKQGIWSKRFRDKAKKHVAML